MNLLDTSASETAAATLGDAAMLQSQVFLVNQDTLLFPSYASKAVTWRVLNGCCKSSEPFTICSFTIKHAAAAAAAAAAAVHVLGGHQLHRAYIAWRAYRTQQRRHCCWQSCWLAAAACLQQEGI
jgi:hypothetical protein